MNVRARNNVTVSGGGARTMLLAHGYGCDQEMWRFVQPDFERDHQVVRYDLTGAGKSDLSAYDWQKYASLEGHATDILEICEELDLRDVILVGHSVSATTSVLAANRAPEVFSRLILLAPSPCFLNDGDYRGGFSRQDLEELIAFMDENYLGWAEYLGPVVSGQGPDGTVTQDLTRSFCRTDPKIAQHFGRVTFLSDHRADVARSTVPSLIVQCLDDAIAPREVGAWMQRNMTDATLEEVAVTGHCPHMTAPEETIRLVRAYLS